LLNKGHDLGLVSSKSKPCKTTRSYELQIVLFIPKISNLSLYDQPYSFLVLYTIIKLANWMKVSKTPNATLKHNHNHSMKYHTKKVRPSQLGQWLPLEISISSWNIFEHTNNKWHQRF
jgi:hypothetical protein